MPEWSRITRLFYTVIQGEIGRNRNMITRFTGYLVYFYTVIQGVIWPEPEHDYSVYRISGVILHCDSRGNLAGPGI